MGKAYPRLVISAPGSGHGKTLLTCGLLLAFGKLNKKATAFKCGPDYIDPMFHESVLHTKSKNLDTYFTDRALTRALFAEDAKKADVSLIEGVMGYYDGLGGTSTDASTYDLAGVLEAPGILIVNGAAASLSVCAVIKGFLEYRKPSHIKGVILNQISDNMYPRLKRLIEEELQIPVCGYLPKMPELILESRHLGLVLPKEQKQLKEQMAMLEAQCLKTVDLDVLLKISASAPEFGEREEQAADVSKKYRAVRIAIARDKAFCFYYKDNLRILEKFGAEFIAFSPLEDNSLPEGIDGLMLGGGYPELYAKELEQNGTMRASVRTAIQEGLPCIAECGGFLYLKESMKDRSGNVCEMVGALEGKGYFTGKLSRFGYIELKAKKNQLFGKSGIEIKGHEFHYMDTTKNGNSFLAQKPMSDRNWECVQGNGALYAGFPHLYLYSNKIAAEQFVQVMEERRYDAETN